MSRTPENRPADTTAPIGARSGNSDERMSIFARRSSAERAMGSRCRAWLLLTLSCVALNVAAAPAEAQDRYEGPRLRMVREVIEAEGIDNPLVLAAMKAVPRHKFVAPALAVRAYQDVALPIGSQQTISSPYIVAYMTQTLDPQPTDRVLEIGTGSGYQAAVLAEIVDQVYSVEIVSRLAKSASKRLKELGYDNVQVRDGDGYEGWAEHAPFDRIIVTCSPESVPQPLIDQLKEGGRMIIPLGERYQQAFYLLKKEDGQLVEEKLVATLFVPMTGESEDQRRVKPDPRNPSVVNGDFEYDENDDGRVDGWHYQRQVELSTDSPIHGSRCLRFQSEGSALSQALQGTGIDGRFVGALNIAIWARTDSVVPGSGAGESASLVIHFYDAIRRDLGTQVVCRWRGTSNWQEVRRRIPVPAAAREMIIRIGLNGATGTLDLDQFRMQPVPRR